MTQSDPYAVLGVPVHADADAIAAAYRDKARRHHPDVSKAPDAERRMAEINAAWATLRDPARRAAWDRANLRPGSATGSAPASGRGSGAGPPHHARRPAAGQAHAAAPGPAGQHRTAPPAHGHPMAVPAWRLGPNGEGAAGPPPGPRRGTVLPFGRHIGWSLGEVARADPGYLVWLKERREGAPYRLEIEHLLAAMGGPAAPPRVATRRRGMFG